MMSFSVHLTLFYVTMVTSLISSDSPTFSGLSGAIADANCNVEDVDRWHKSLQAKVSALLDRPYFKYYKTVLYKPCELWNDSDYCFGRGCAVLPCDAENLPIGIRNETNRLIGCDGAGAAVAEDDSLGKIDTDMSASAEAVQTWTDKDGSLFCELPDDSDDPESVFVDLRRNPERFNSSVILKEDRGRSADTSFHRRSSVCTGYRGESAWRIWRAIYNENCFWRDVFPSDFAISMNHGNHSELCYENQVFHKVISGLHTSINVHLCAEFYFTGKLLSDHWGYNLVEFTRRFGAVATDNKGIEYLKNLYFLLAVEQRALLKAKKDLTRLMYYAESEEESNETRRSVDEILTFMSNNLPCAFNESRMFVSDEAERLRKVFSTKFVNITKIMDCVGCDKCRMWGRLQTQALGTAFNILFSNTSTGSTSIPAYLSRWNIVALFNGFGRTLAAITHVNHFRRLADEVNKPKIEL